MCIRDRIECADIRFGPGFNALTGETGAGKSIVIDSISAVLGEMCIRDRKNLSRAIRLHTEEGALAIDISLLVKFGINIQAVAKSVQEAVATSVESVIGLKVSAVNVHVSGVAFEK